MRPRLIMALAATIALSTGQDMFQPGGHRPDLPPLPPPDRIPDPVREPEKRHGPKRRSKAERKARNAKRRGKGK